jgi:hypothetical protein
MKLALFWSRQTADATARDGRRVRAAARGWSNDSLDAAAAMASKTAQHIASLLADGRTKLERYQYGDRPIPEPVIKEFPDGSSPRAVVTRNVYGAFVLNTRDLMFVDIDSDEPSAAATSFLSAVMGLFGKKQQQPAPSAPSPVEELVRQVAATSGLSLRLYKTAGGHRAIVTNAPYGATADASDALLRDFGADPLYIRLCRQQESFRARLTPKPWRMRMSEPPVTYPFQTPAEQNRFDRWDATYASNTARFATCRFIRTLGPTEVASGFQELIDFHDAQTKADSDLPLA